ncbi:unnamed protein product [Camellia sinensis]
MRAAGRVGRNDLNTPPKLEKLRNCHYINPLLCAPLPHTLLSSAAFLFGDRRGELRHIWKIAADRSPFLPVLPLICTKKVDVNGENAAPIYKFLKLSKGGFFGNGIEWNFSKVLADQDGNVIGGYAPTTSPVSIEKDIKKLLKIT